MKNPCAGNSGGNDLYVAIDAGGTKTEMVLFAGDGTVRSRWRGKGCNPSRIGLEHAGNDLCAMLTELLRDHGGESLNLESLFAGIAGGTVVDRERYLEKRFRAWLPNAKRVMTGSDMVNALNSGLGRRQDGMALIAGTGSVAYVRIGGVGHRIGGWGPMLDDEGSGFHIGRLALKAALMEADGRGPATLLSALCEKQLGRPVPEAIAEIEQRGPTYAASFAPLVFQAARQQDGIAGRILEQCADNLALLGHAGLSRFPASVTPRLTVVGGVLSGPGNPLLELLTARLNRPCEIILPDLPPVFGAAVEAMELADRVPDEPFRDRFRESLNNHPIKDSVP
jgi:N-acetylglucosamine kinase-like BadF-type ATPase